ncbi:MAG: hypothetical protein GF315_00215 [candidate division Zixibacteria bacterium]|nr:hypothetical protein [candidate division Zixibacteria bacterium]
MINVIKSLLGVDTPDTAKHDTDNIKSASNRVALATAVVFLEMAHIDKEFGDEEREHIPELLKDIFRLSDDEIADIIESAEKEIDQSLDLWQFTNVINQNFTNEQKQQIIYAVWRLVYVDGNLDKHENYLMHKLSKLLNLPHSVLIDGKLRALQETKE